MGTAEQHAPRKQRRSGATLFEGLRQAREPKDVLSLFRRHEARIRVQDFGFLLSRLMELEGASDGADLSKDAREVLREAAERLPKMLKSAKPLPKGTSPRQRSKSRFSALSSVIQAFHAAGGGEDEVLDLAAAAAAETLGEGHPASVARAATGLAAHGRLRGPFLERLAERVEAECAEVQAARAPSNTAAVPGGDGGGGAVRARAAAPPADAMDGFSMLVTASAAVSALEGSPAASRADRDAAWRVVRAADQALPSLLPLGDRRRAAANAVSAVDAVTRAVRAAPSARVGASFLSSSRVLSSEWVAEQVEASGGQVPAAHGARARTAIARAERARVAGDGACSTDGASEVVMALEEDVGAATGGAGGGGGPGGEGGGAEARAAAAALRVSPSASDTLSVWEEASDPAVFDPHLFADAGGRLVAQLLAETGAAGGGATQGGRNGPGGRLRRGADASLGPRVRAFLAAARRAARAASSRGITLHPGVAANLVWALCRLEQAHPSEGEAAAREHAGVIDTLVTMAEPMVRNGSMDPLNVARLLAGLDAGKHGVTARARGLVGAAADRLGRDMEAFDDWQAVTASFAAVRLGCRLGPAATGDLGRRAASLLADCAPAALAVAPRPGAPRAATVPDTTHRLCVFALWACLRSDDREAWRSDPRVRSYAESGPVRDLLTPPFRASLLSLLDDDGDAGAGHASAADGRAESAAGRALMARLRRARSADDVAAALDGSPGALDLRLCVEALERLAALLEEVTSAGGAAPGPRDGLDDLVAPDARRRAAAAAGLVEVCSDLADRMAESASAARDAGSLTVDFASHMLFGLARLPLPRSRCVDVVRQLRPFLLEACAAQGGTAADVRDVARALSGLGQLGIDDPRLTEALFRAFVAGADGCSPLAALMAVGAVSRLSSAPSALLEGAVMAADAAICAAAADPDAMTADFAAGALASLVLDLGLVQADAAVALIPLLRRGSRDLSPERARRAQRAIRAVIDARSSAAGADDDGEGQDRA